MQDGVQVINMTANNSGYVPNAFYVQKGVPVKWIINGEQLNSCNNAIVAQSIDKELKLKKGENIIEFTPGDKDINFSCWMGMIRGIIKVTDTLDAVDTSKAASSVPAPSAGDSCCAPSGGATGQPSIYGNDITKAPTERLINKALSTGKYQSAKFKGIGYELEPLIVVSGSAEKTKLSFDLTDFDSAEGKFQIVSVLDGKEVSSFEGKKGVTEVEFGANKAGGYAILKDSNVIGIIELVEDLKNTDLEEIRANYLQ
jgi:plastocyanin domain-containing protein